MRVRNIMRRALVLAACLLIYAMLAWSAVAQEPSNPASADRAQAAANGEGTASITIGSGDLLEISVYDLPDLSQVVRISNSGNVSLALLGAVHLAGLSPDKAETLIEEKLRDGRFVKNPHVSVFVKEYNSQGISVMGEVNKPGVYPLLGPRRLYDVIAVSGGMTAKAGSVVTITRRDRPEEPITVAFSVDPAKSQGSNVAIFPGDTVVVSKAGMVYVVGDVALPGGFVMENRENVSVLQAVALARGANHTASVNRAKIIRQGPNGLQEIPISLDKILAGKAPDVTLQNNDIVFVPTSAAKSVARRSLESIVQVATGVAIYRR
jgi:polysaccharide biosynthesis/export protein